MAFLFYDYAYISGGDNMEIEDKGNRKRNTYVLFIAAGAFILIYHLFGFAVVISILFILLGLRALRTAEMKKGYIMLGIGAILIIGHFFVPIVAIVLVSLGFYFLKTKQHHWKGAYLNRQKIIESLHWNKRPWSLHSMSNWNIIGEIKLDFGLAIWEEPEVTIILQGVIGDIDIIVPENVGIIVTGSVVFGQIEVELKKEAGMLNKIVWQSPNYHTCTNKVKLQVSYIVADVDVKII
jgi:lia operon protein LiaF